MDFLAEVEKKLDLPPGEKAEVIRELKSHYDELRGELVASGMDAALAAQEASRKLGDPADVSSRLQAIHCRATWKTALLTACPFLGGVFSTILRIPAFRSHQGTYAYASALHSYWIHALIITAVVTAILVIGSIRELVHNRRPIWLTTWLAVGMLGLVGIVQSGEGIYSLTAPPESQPSIYLSVVFMILLLGAAAMTTFRRSTRHFLILGGWTALAEVVYAAMHVTIVHTGWFAYFLIVIPAPLVMAVALGIFGHHPYGNAAQASLFLFAFYAGTRSYSTIDYHWMLMLAGSLLPTLAILATVLAYTRSAGWQRKVAILAGGIIAANLAGSIMVIRSVVALGLSVAAFYIILTAFEVFWVVVFPLLFERRWSDRRPEFVR